MKKIILYVVIIIAVLIGIFMLLMPKGAKYSDFAYLSAPRIITKPSEKVIEVKVMGDPSTSVQPAMSLLLKTYFRLEGVKHGMDIPAPKSRWYTEFDKPRNTWEGEVAITIPGSVKSIPEIKDKSGLKIELTTWEYGEVAEILHVGSYGSEEADINKLKDFIDSQGYEISGPHEEEYLKGPLPFMPTNPDKYLTIIRYRVEKKEGGV